MPRKKITKRTIEKLFEFGDIFEDEDLNVMFDKSSKNGCNTLASFCKWYINSKIKEIR